MDARLVHQRPLHPPLPRLLPRRRRRRARLHRLGFGLGLGHRGARMGRENGLPSLVPVSEYLKHVLHQQPGAYGVRGGWWDYGVALRVGGPAFCMTCGLLGMELN